MFLLFNIKNNYFYKIKISMGGIKLIWARIRIKILLFFCVVLKCFYWVGAIKKEATASFLLNKNKLLK